MAQTPVHDSRVPPADSLSPAEAIVLLRGIYVGATALAQDILSDALPNASISVSLCLMTVSDSDLGPAATQDPAAAWYLQLRSPAGRVAEWHTGVPGPAAGGPSTQALVDAGFSCWEGPAEDASNARWLASTSPSGMA